MRLIANEYQLKEIVRMIRESTELTQEKFGETIFRTGRSVRSLESGERNLSVETLLQIAKIHKFKIIIEKEKSGIR